MRVAVIHGPNLNLLGTRQPHIYGSTTLGQLEDRIGAWASRLGVEVSFFQSNDEGSLVDAIQGSTPGHDAIILNPGGYTHTSVAIADALSSVTIPCVEVHLSDIRRREAWRSVSIVAASTVRQIQGRGPAGYRDALRHLVNRSMVPYETLSYGPDPEQVGDHRAGNASRGLVVLVHGGLWLGQWERDTTESLAVGLHQAGYDTLNIEYRRLGDRPVWPASGHDVEMAIRFAGHLKREVIVIGHSAGGYLGLWTHRRNPRFGLLCLAPLTDLASAQSDHRSLAEVVASGAPATLRAPARSVFLLHGAEDTIVPPRQSERFTQECRVEILPELGHFDLLDPSRPHWDLLLAGLEKASREQTELPHPPVDN